MKVHNLTYGNAARKEAILDSVIAKLEARRDTLTAQFSTGQGTETDLVRTLIALAVFYRRRKYHMKQSDCLVRAENALGEAKGIPFWKSLKLRMEIWGVKYALWL